MREGGGGVRKFWCKNLLAIGLLLCVSGRLVVVDVLVKEVAF